MFGSEFDRERSTTGGSGFGASSLDSAPPSPPIRRDSTRAFTGDNPDAGTGPLASDPQAKGIAAVAMLLQAVNMIESLTPGQLTPQFILEVTQLQNTYPQVLQQLSQMSGFAQNLMAVAGPGMGGSAGGGMGMGGGLAAPGASSQPASPSLAQSAGLGSAMGGKRPSF